MNNRKMGCRDFIINPFLSHTSGGWLLCTGTSWGGERTQKVSEGVNNCITVEFSCSISKRFFFSKWDIAGRNFSFHYPGVKENRCYPASVAG